MNDEEADAQESKSTFMPLIIAVGVAVLLLGIAIYVPFVIVGLIIIAAGLFKLFKDGAAEKYADRKEVAEEKFPLESVSKEKLGVWVFLSSEILIFGSLIIAYVYVRVSSGAWPVASQTHNVLLGMTNTIILLTSSLTMILALYSIRKSNVAGLKICLLSTFALGFAFLGIKLGIEWPALIRSGFTISSGLPASSYYVLTGLHAAHVAVGLVMVGYLMFRTYSGGFTSTKHGAVENVGLYWHFVDIVWMFLFPLFYLI
ncbi:MAG: heme-copper oxidase subunit III [Candidatus Bathyarchaeia archaeon]|jgi:cytochrome c oxidase subunit I+III